MVRAHVFVGGRVQGVFFRDTARREAEQRGVAGWVRNLPDGRVEAVFEGPEEAVEAMVRWCREGTPWSHVEDVEVSREDPEGLEGFRIRWGWSPDLPAAGPLHLRAASFPHLSERRW